VAKQFLSTKVSYLRYFNDTCLSGRI